MKTSTAPSYRVLLADDQQDIRDSLRLLLKGEGYETQGVASPAEALNALEAREFDAVLMDLNYARDTTSGQEGLDLFTRIQVLDSTVPVVVMTAWSSIELAVEAMRRGARDFIAKPWENNRLLSILRTQIDLRQALRQASRLEAENRLLRAESRPTFLANSPAMAPVMELIAQIGPSDANVLVTGEHGTGKEVVARTLHALSARASKPMVTVNAGGLSEGVFESELFGHVKGAFTDARADRVGRFELADGSTLFLDEIANVPLNLQAKLLRVLETGDLERVGSSTTRRVNVRVLAATNADVNAEAAAGRFRQDLLFRLNTIEIHVPPLRDRREDIDLLAHHFLHGYAQRYRKNISGFDTAAIKALHEHAWPGNVRELDHAVERGVLLSPGPSVRAADLGLRAQAAGGPAKLEEMSLDEVERYLIQRTLSRHEGNVSQAAKALGEVLRQQRLGALEANALLRTVMEEIDLAVFTFDNTGKLRLVNRAGERLLGRPEERLLGFTAEELGLGACLEGEAAHTMELAFPGGSGRWGMRRGTFRQGGLPHHLVVLTDLSRTLRDEERKAWQRLIRVLGHELNNSLAPIQSVAQGLESGLLNASKSSELQTEASAAILDDLRQGLGIIRSRTEALGRFMAAYAQLARLPQPKLLPVNVSEWINRSVKLETRVKVNVSKGPDVVISADADQLEQLLINLVGTAADATLETGGSVQVGWSRKGAHLDVWVIDEGPGLPNTSNLFVPFFTTKPGGSGIGLVLSRQIAEAHGGELTLKNRSDARGCRALLRLPV